jgi:hypothetical protein
MKFEDPEEQEMSAHVKRAVVTVDAVLALKKLVLVLVITILLMREIPETTTAGEGARAL